MFQQTTGQLIATKSLFLHILQEIKYDEIAHMNKTNSDIFFLIDKHKYIKGQKVTKHTGSIHSSLTQEHKKQATSPTLKWPLATPKSLKGKRTPLQCIP